MSDNKYYDVESTLNVTALTKNSAMQLPRNTSLNNEIDIGKPLPEGELLASQDVSSTILCKPKQENSKSAVTEPANKPMQSSMLSKLNVAMAGLQLSKIFANKTNKVVVLVVLLSVVLVLFLNVNNGLTTTTSGNMKNTYNSLEYVSSKAYVENLENKLESVLSQIKGAGQVTVMVTLQNGPELKIANSVDERTNTSTTNGNTTNSVTVVENPIIITQNGTSSPLVLMEIMPKIQGVVVVAEGANNVRTKLELLEAVQSLLEIENNNIQIYAGI